jgi:hypothetical protein
MVNRMSRHFNKGRRTFNAYPRPMREENVLPQCPICKKAVPLETAKADEYGRAIHEQCYLLKVCLEDATTLSRLRKLR